MLRIENHGPLIVSSNYWTLPAARAGKVLVSINAGAFRVLIPQSIEGMIPEMMTGKSCVVSRGPMAELNLPDAFEVLFDDGTADPFAFHLSPQSFDRIPEDADAGREWVLSAWTAPRRGRPHKAFERPCWYRRVPSLPWLKPHSGD